MIKSIRRLFKKALLSGAIGPSPRLVQMNGMLACGRWLRGQHVQAPAPFIKRSEMFDYIAHEVIAAGTPIDYLEFGVFEGYSVREWVKFNSHPDSRFYGFDLFTGLPEEWHTLTGYRPGGTFDTGGVVPQIDDDRVQFIKGKFQDTLRQFLASYAPQNRLVLHLDADLYASTLYALATLDPYLTPGTIVMFHDFYHESIFRAFQDYHAAFGRQSRVLALNDFTRESGLSIEMTN